MKKNIFVVLFLLTCVVNGQVIDKELKNKAEYSSMGLIAVTIGGSFIVNGTFDALVTERADQFITRIYNQTRMQALSAVRDEKTLNQVKLEFENYSKRNIVLKRTTGEEFIIDLEKFWVTADFKYNPALRSDDVIIFPELNLKKNFIDISGAVNKPVVFEYSTGDKLSDAMIIAQGINPAYANVTQAAISRLSPDGQTEEQILVNIKDDCLLKRGDRISVLFSEVFKNNFKVQVIGEVNRPGFVYITKNNTTLKEVIEKAGGFTPEASLGMSELIRGYDKFQLMKKLEAFKVSNQYYKDIGLLLNEDKNIAGLDELMMIRSSDIAVEDSAAFIVDNKLRLLQSNGIVNFENIYDKDSEDGNFIVKDGDIILVPEKQDMVYVFGQVKNPGYTKYISGRAFDYYITAAGGYGDNAVYDVKIIKGKSRSWISAANTTEIESGDFIYVPKDVPRRFSYYIQQAGYIATIVGAVSTLVLVIYNVMSN